MISWVRSLVCVIQQLTWRGWLARVAEEGEDRLGAIARLLFELREIDGAAVDARRRPGLQSPHGQRELAKAGRQRDRRRVARATRLVAREAHVDEAPQERARREDDRGSNGSEGPGPSRPRRRGRPRRSGRRRRIGRATDWPGTRGGAGWRFGTGRGRPGRASHARQAPCWHSGSGTGCRLRRWPPPWHLRGRPLPSRGGPCRCPPIEGLQDICPSVSSACVSRSVRAPARADARAASVPAWPPPTTITSKRSGKSMGSGARKGARL